MNVELNLNALEKPLKRLGESLARNLSSATSSLFGIHCAIPVSEPAIHRIWILKNGQIE